MELFCTLVWLLFAGFYGKTDLEKLRIDMIVDSIDDLIDKMLALYGAETEEQKVQ